MKLNHKFALLLAGAVLAGSLTGCGASSAPASSAASSEAAASSAVSEAASEPAAEAALPDGVYTADFDTDSSMFHANEANDGKGTLTVKDGQMTFHVSLASKKIVNLYVGMAADAEAHEGDWLQPTTDTVTYSDGTSDEVYGFDIPVEALDEDFQLAILGTKGKWYESPAALTVADGRLTATIVWSSPNYDYMLVDGEKYLPTNTEGNSTFEIPVAALDTPLDVVGDTVAMSTPHEIEYTLTFASASLIEAK